MPAGSADNSLRPACTRRCCYPRWYCWLITVCGGIAAVSPILLQWWHPDLPTATTPPVPGVRRQDPLALLGNYFLYAGLVFLAIGVLIGLLAGIRVLLASAIAGLLLGTTAMLVATLPLAKDYAVVTVAVVLLTLVAGYLAAMSRWRWIIAGGGLAVVIAGLVLLAALAGTDTISLTGGFGYTIDIALVVFGGVGSFAALGSVCATFTDRWDMPVVLAGTTTPFTIAALTIVAHCFAHGPRGAPMVGLALPAIGALIVVLTLLGALYAVAQNRPATLTAEPPTTPIRPR